MKICLLTPGYPRYKGDDSSVKDYLHDLGKNLTKSGIEVHVLAPHAEGINKEEVMDGVYIHRFQYFYPSSFQTLAYTVGILEKIKTIEGKMQVPFFFLSLLFNTIKLIRKEKIDVINSHWLLPQGLVGAICKKIFKIPHISTIHAAGLFGLEHLPFKRKIANFIVKNTDEIIVVSFYIGERLLHLISPELNKNTEKKLIILPMGIDVQSFQITNNKIELLSEYKISSKFNLLFLGRLGEKKGIPYLINAMPSIISQIEDVNLIICGNGPLRKELEQLVKSMNLEKYVRFTGFVSNGEKIDYFHLADILIVPSIVAQSGDTEGLPVTILEGLAAGKPIIASDVSGVKDIIKDGYNGFLVEQKNPEQIEEKVLELFDDEELRVRFSKNALETAKNYDWEVIGKTYMKIICFLCRSYNNEKEESI
ncbi:MAG: glycosyltransferase family 4 protein [Candidatus Marinimicrobia bacterium]|nr:glycosyltransferase family 4 protein [Candidatus Neomarinimicrobiota bacterium]